MYGGGLGNVAPQTFSSADYANRGVPMNLMMGPMYNGANGQGSPGMIRYGRRPGNEQQQQQAPLAVRSPLLEEFRMNKARKWELRVSDVRLFSCGS